jgi:hypothetical protein
MAVIAPIQQEVIKILETLPPDKQQTLLTFAEFLQAQTKIPHPRKSWEGLCVDLNIDITEEEIKEAKQEMWKNFPKEIEL